MDCHLKRVTPLEEVNEPLRQLCLQWATAVFAEKRHDMKENEGYRDAVAAGERFRVILLRSSVSTVHIAWADITVHSFTRELS